METIENQIRQEAKHFKPQSALEWRKVKNHLDHSRKKRLIRKGLLIAASVIILVGFIAILQQPQSTILEAELSKSYAFEYKNALNWNPHRLHMIYQEYLN